MAETEIETTADNHDEAPLLDITGTIDALLDEAGIDTQRKLVQRMVQTALGLGQDRTTRLDLKIVAAALEEMRAAFQIFAPFRGDPKVTIFGSARTKNNDALWRDAELVSEQLAALGWTIVTGAGPGIMEAAATGAGEENSLGVSIRLPFEETPNSVVTQNGRLVAMKYFFTRKLMLVKESRGFICLPGGFGTMDEAFELLTLQQTGKAIPVPIVLLDTPGGRFWHGFEEFTVGHLERTGMISPGDLDRVLITDSVDAAVSEITGFWRNYDSLRWVGSQLVFRLRSEPSDAELDDLTTRFSSMLASGRIERTEPLQVELSDRDDRQTLGLPRVIFTPRPRAAGELHRLIRAFNALPSAPDSPPVPTEPEA